MQLLLKRLQTEWASWLVVAFVALLPFGRAPEVPLSILALALPFLLRNPAHRQRALRLAVFLLPLFLCFWLPMVLSSFDSYTPEKSSLRSLAALRYLAAAISIGILLSPPSARWRVLRWTAFLLAFWALDGFIQLYFGADLFGVHMHKERLNALFLHQYQFYGPTLAMLSPLLLEYARRRWPAWAWVLSFALVLGAVTIAGMRSGWLVMAVVLAVYGVLLIMNRENRSLRFASVSVPVLAVITILAGYAASPILQQRLEQTLSALDASEASVNFASTYRLPIFKTALRMYEAHPVNGVGVRAFSIAYLDYADPDDVHVRNFGGTHGALHAHNVVLEVMADTGTIGLLGLLTGALLFWRYWRLMTPAQRQECFPYALSISLVFFPVNSHFAVFGTYLSSLVWVLLGLWAATWPEEPRMPVNRKTADPPPGGS
jgi:O-antigen ligase